jgi:hypothetical protein
MVNILMVYIEQTAIAMVTDKVYKIEVEHK